MTSLTKTIYFALLASLLLGFSILSQLQAAQTNNAPRTFYCSWDNSLQPDIAAGAVSFTGQESIVDSSRGKVLQITDKPISYMPNGNFTRDQGSMSLWFKLAPDAASKRQAIFSATNFRFQIYRDKNQVFFMTGAKLPGKNFKWDYSLLLRNKHIPVDQWIHLAMTWDMTTGKKAVYLNGKLAGQTQTPFMEAGHGGQSMKIGDGAAGLYDELNIWSTVLTAEQINEVYTQGAPKPQAIKPRDDNPVGWRIEPQLAYLNYSDSIIAPGQSITINLPFINQTQSPQTMTARLTVLDTWEKQVLPSDEISLTLQPNEKQIVSKTITLDQLGCYKLRITDVQNQACLKEVTSFACLPQGNPPAHPFFGAHVNATQNMPEMARRIGYAKNRVHNMTQFTWWVRLEPERGQWQIDKQKQTYDRYNDLGFEHYGQWFGSPYWAVTLPDGNHPTPRKANSYPAGWAPTDEQAIRDYVTRTIQAFPRIKQWEMWNEPYVSMFWQGSPDQYFQLCRIMYQQAKQVRPDLQVYAQLPYDSPWLDRVLELGLLDYCDGIAYHRYYKGSEHPQAIAMPVNKLRKRLADFGKADLPLINSESGVTGTTFLRGLHIPEFSPEILQTEFQFREAASMMVQSNIVLMSLDVKARYHYFHQPVNIRKGRAYPNYTTCEITRSPLPMAISNAILVWQLDGGNIQQTLSPVNGLRVYLAKRNDGKTLAIVWCEDQAKINLTANAQQALNMMGNPLENKDKITIADEPVYLIFDQTANAVASQFTKNNIQIIAKPIYAQQTSDDVVVAPLPPMPDFQVATEIGLSRLHPVDLSNFVNMSTADPIQGDGKGGWTDEGPNNDASMITPGKHTWFGVPFIMPGKTINDPSVITLKGMTFNSGPISVGPIPVNQERVRGLFFAHAANWMSGKVNEVPVIYTVTYEDGSTVEIPMRGGREINNWWFKPTEDEDSRSIQFVHPDPITRKSPARYLRVVYWENPKTNKPIKSISLRCNDQKKTYVLCGITVAKW
ncbi:MAG: LamG-like jellyroll fold domain-containing protein [Phycisphaeraceae bacterium JB051]